MGIADRTAYLLANPKELEAFVIAAEKNADDWLALNREAHVLVEFAKAAPGRLPSRVQEAIAHVSGMPVDGGLCNCRDRCTGACCPKPAAGVAPSHAPSYEFRDYADWWDRRGQHEAYGVTSLKAFDSVAFAAAREREDDPSGVNPCDGGQSNG